MTRPIASTRLRVRIPVTALTAGATPPTSRASHTLPPAARMP